jgi:hypothetical protein
MLALLAGCAGGGTGITAPAAGGGVTQLGVTRAMPDLRESFSVARPGVQRHAGATIPVKPFINSEAIAKASNTIALSDFYGNSIEVFDSKGSLDATLTDGFSGPQGLASDINGDLFIADGGNARIVRYAAGFKGTPTSISDPGEIPVGVDTFSNGKWLAATNIFTASGGPGSVTIYKQNNIIGTVTSPNLLRAYFCAFDATGDLFVSGVDGNYGTSVGEIAHATSGGTLNYTELTTNNTLTFPGGIQVTTTGSIVFDDQGQDSGSTIYTYNPAKNGSLGSPTAVTQLRGSTDVITFALTNTMADLYGADAGNLDAAEWVYPAGGKSISSFPLPNAGLPIGVAIVPTQYPKVQ